MKDAPVLVVGANGMLGRAFRELFDEREVPYRGVDLGEIDVTDPDSVRAVVTPEYGTVINCAAYTDVDRAEADEETARKVNADAVGHLARRARDVEAFLVHFGTDYVFDGKARQPYAVDHFREPVGAYGRTKEEGERQLHAAGVPHLLIRTSWLYAPWAKNFVLTIAKLSRERPSLRVVDDQRGRPTEARHLARSTWALRTRGSSGTFHVTDGGLCTWFELARYLVEQVGSDCVVEPCTTEEFGRPAPRPAYSVLDLSKTEAVLGPMPPWEEHVRRALVDAGLVAPG